MFKDTKSTVSLGGVYEAGSRRRVTCKRAGGAGFLPISAGKASTIILGFKIAASYSGLGVGTVTL